MLNDLHPLKPCALSDRFPFLMSAYRKKYDLSWMSCLIRSVARCGLDIDHQCLLWCSELVEQVALAMAETIGSGPPKSDARSVLREKLVRVFAGWANCFVCSKTCYSDSHKSPRSPGIKDRLLKVLTAESRASGILEFSNSWESFLVKHIANRRYAASVWQA